jgi:hypothetical protein
MAPERARRGTLLAQAEPDARAWGADGMLFTVRQVTDESCGTTRWATRGLRLRPRGRDPIELQRFGLGIGALPSGHAEYLRPEGRRVGRAGLSEARQPIFAGRWVARTHRPDASGFPGEPSLCASWSSTAARAWRLAA